MPAEYERLTVATSVTPFEVQVPDRDRTAESDSPFGVRRVGSDVPILGGAPTYVLTDNEKIVTVSHLAGVPVLNQKTVPFARHYGGSRS